MFNGKPTTKTVAHFLKVYKCYYLPIFFISIFVALIQSLVVATLFPIFNLFLGVSKVPAGSAGFFFAAVSKMIEMIPFSDKIISGCALLILLAVIQSLFEILNEFLISYASAVVLYDVQNNLMHKYARLPYQYFLDTKQGQMLYDTMKAPAQLAQVLLRMPQIFTESVKVIAIMTVLFFLNPYITVILFILGLCISVLIGFLSKRYTYRIAKQNIDLLMEQNTIFNEFINGIKQLSVYGAKERWVAAFSGLSRKLKSLQTKSNTWLFVPSDLLQLFIFVAVFTVIVFVKICYPATFFEQLSVMGLYAVSMIKLLPSVNNLGRRRMEMASALPDFERILSMLQKDGIEKSQKGKIFLGLKDSIVFRDVRFSHKEGRDLLRGINVIFKKNTITAIVGDSGSGKTTLLNIMLGLFQPSSGRIEVDGTDINEYDMKSWLSRIGFVSQDPFIYHSTIWENITLGSKNYSRENIIKAARMAAADSFIMEFPDRYDTIVGERGMKLSGGQQQRIAIARAILRNPEIIILDEATSALDNISEKAVQSAINAISRNRTVIIVAHRLSTVQNADKIVFLRDGVIVEEGSHDELISKNGFYKNMYTQQD